MNLRPSAFASLSFAALLAVPGALIAGPGGFANGTTVSGTTTQGTAIAPSGRAFSQGGFRGATTAPAPVFVGRASSGLAPSIGPARPVMTVPDASAPTYRQRVLPPARSGAVQPNVNPGGLTQVSPVVRENYLQARTGRATLGSSDSQRFVGQVRTGETLARGGYYRQTDANRARIPGFPRGNVGGRSVDLTEANRHHEHQHRPQYSCPWQYGGIFINGGYGYGYGYGYPSYYSYAAPYDYSGLSFTSPEGYYDYNVPSVEPAPTDGPDGTDLDVPPPPAAEDHSKDTPGVDRGASTGLPPEPNSLVQAVQKELTRRGYFSGQPDGIVTRDFQESLRRFQVDQRLVTSGLINQASPVRAGPELILARQSR